MIGLRAKAILLAGCAMLMPIPGSYAQKITGAAGSPSATTTIDGAQLPPPPPKFGGKIEREATKSTPYWPARIVPPEGAPNVLGR